MSEKRVCGHCGVEITLVNYALGPTWMHDPYPHHFGEEYRYCRSVVAEPKLDAPKDGAR